MVLWDIFKYNKSGFFLFSQENSLRQNQNKVTYFLLNFSFDKNRLEKLTINFSLFQQKRTIFAEMPFCNTF
jgi:alkyl sulfatase BDS1-like metallo-beta-lactamase superfamily hydrolase